MSDIDDMMSLYKYAESVTLKPCPFCGSAAAMRVEVFLLGGILIDAHCKNITCGAKMAGSSSALNSGAIDYMTGKWNGRVER